MGPSAFILVSFLISSNARISVPEQLVPKPIETEILFPRGEEAFIVASPSNQLERRVLERLSTYMRDVLRADVRVVGSTGEVPVGVQRWCW